MITLDEAHQKIINKFQVRKRTLPKKETKLTRLKKQLNDLDKKPKENMTNDDIHTRAKLKTDIRVIEEEIHDISHSVSEMEYYSKIDDILMDYYDILEHEDNTLYDINPEMSDAKPLNKQEDKLDKLVLLNQLKNKKFVPKKVTKRRKKKVNINQGPDIFSYFGVSVNNNTASGNVGFAGFVMVTEFYR